MAYIESGFPLRSTTAYTALISGLTGPTVTTAGIPATVSIGHIAPVSNYVPYFKIGAM